MITSVKSVSCLFVTVDLLQSPVDAGRWFMFNSHDVLWSLEWISVYRIPLWEEWWEIKRRIFTEEWGETEEREMAFICRSKMSLGCNSAEQGDVLLSCLTPPKWTPHGFKGTASVILHPLCCHRTTSWLHALPSASRIQDMEMTSEMERWRETRNRFGTERGNRTRTSKTRPNVRSCEDL